MSSRAPKAGLFLLIAVLGLGAAAYFFYHRSPGGDLMMDENKALSMQDPAFDFTFQYPSQGWGFSASQGRSEAYQAVYLRGPVDARTNFATLAEIAVKTAGAEETAKGLRENFLKRVEAWPEFQVIGKKELKVDGETGASVIWEHEAFLPMESLSAKPVMVSEETVFLVRGGKTYRIAFHALSAQRKEYSPVFEKVLKTFRFKE